MNILVYLKQILDPEVPVPDFSIDSSGLQANPACESEKIWTSFAEVAGWFMPGREWRLSRF